ncbi:hypothetical protein ANCCAN_25363 [Ancylostoma caninum]|uniref:Carboxylesterase type B domain-containing protein n=1 Tax=Ancylostoma caninum TaxID=29170 RepID=A0A368FD07_ANCCA|nr:hypothetical protein ANCCAN_25363 [Ancylostoma caninum]
MTFAFVPVSADKNFFKGDVFERLRSRNFKKDVAAIFGTVKDEGTYWLPYYMSEYGFWFNHTISAEDPQNKALITRLVRCTKLKFSWIKHCSLGRNIGSRCEPSCHILVGRHWSNTHSCTLINMYRIDQQYQLKSHLGKNEQLRKPRKPKFFLEKSRGVPSREQLRDGVGRFLGDYFFTCSLIEFADIIADNVYGPVYMYYFTMRSTANPWPKWMGVMHGYEIEYAFGQPLTRPSLYDKSYLETEQRFSEYILQLWADFSDTGVPAPYWPKYNRIERKALVLGEESTRGEHRVVVDLHGSYCRLIEEGKTVAGQVSECRARRTQPPAAISGSADGNGLSSLATDTSTFIIAVAVAMRFLVLS